MTDLTYHTEGVPEFVKTLFPDDFKGVCVDIGAHHPTWKNNSLIFENDGWNTYCIEPNSHCIQDLQENRKKVFHCAISNINGEAELFIYGKNNKGEGPNGMAAGTGLQNIYNGGIADEIQIVKTYTLEKFAEDQKITCIDYLSIDTEGTEFNIIESTDLHKLQVKVIVIENTNLLDHREQKKYLNSLGYYWIGRFIYNDIYVGSNTCKDDKLFPSVEYIEEKK